MKPPATIKVGALVYRVKHEPQRLKDIGGDAALYAKEELIAIDQGQSPGYLRDSVLHETIHAVYHETNLYTSGEEAYNREEELVSALTPRLLSLLRDNPRLVQYLTER